METGTQERLAKNESFFRQVNEKIREVAERLQGEQQYEFLCECADPSCTERIELTRDEYETVREKPTRFVLARGHTSPAVEHVVEHEAAHVVIEKVGVAGAIAAKLNPRAA